MASNGLDSSHSEGVWLSNVIQIVSSEFSYLSIARMASSRSFEATQKVFGNFHSRSDGERLNHSKNVGMTRSSFVEMK